MIEKLIFISVLIIIIVAVSWVKDGDKMKPPLKRRIVIEGTTIAVYWTLYLGYSIVGGGEFDKNIGSILDLSLLFFTVRLIQLVTALNPTTKELIAFIKSKLANNSK